MINSAQPDHQPTDVRIASILKLLETVTDPEIPVLTIKDIGILRNVAISQNTVTVTITPTYSGCPAMDRIRSDILETLAEAGYSDAQVDMQLSPAWTTDWMTEQGREKLRQYGIAPPSNCRQSDPLQPLEMVVFCPRCNSADTKLISQFGSTSCKALYRCTQCLEPFDYFKPI